MILFQFLQGRIETKLGPFSLFILLRRGHAFVSNSFLMAEWIQSYGTYYFIVLKKGHNFLSESALMTDFDTEFLPFSYFVNQADVDFVFIILLAG